MLVSMAPYKIDHSRYEKAKERIDAGSEPSIIKLFEYGANKIGDWWDTAQSIAKQDDQTWNKDDRQGYALPGTKYTGPGNSLNRGPGVNDADDDAKLHDEQYSAAHNSADIKKSDKHLLQNAGDHLIEGIQGKGTLGNTILSAVQGAGIGAKHIAENVVGPIYPKTYSTPSAGEPMDAGNEAESARRRRPNDNSLETGVRPAKQSKVVSSSGIPASEGTSDSSQTSEVVGTMSLTGTGKEQASGGASSEGTPPFMIERPLSTFGNKITSFKKVHKVMTFGLAPAIINGVANVNTRLLTTYLAEIPWHIPAFYLNQSEFDNLSIGSHVVSVQIEVYYRGTTIQFQTNQSTTSLATLNQINDIAVATGLNRTGWGQNYRNTGFDTTNTMVPTSVGNPQYRPLTAVGPPATTYRGMVEDYYGTENGNGNFEEYIPHHQIGRHVFLYNYWGMTTRIHPGVPPSQNMFGGWPALAEKFQQMDGKTVVNTCVLKSQYKPKMGPIKQPLTNLNMGLPNMSLSAGINIPIGGLMAEARNANVNLYSNASSGSVHNNTNETNRPYSSNPAVPNFMDIYMPIEKSQCARTGFWGSQTGHIQPSLHIGVQPVPALSTAALLTTNTGANAWTDSRGYWEIVATMHVKEFTPTHMPYATAPNVPPGDVIQFTNSADWPAPIRDASTDGATYAGLYPVSHNPLP